MNYKLKLDEVKLKAKYDQRHKLARKMLKNEIAKDTEKFVPFRGRYLRGSVTQSLQSDDQYLIYNAPYARFLYYGYVMIGRVTHRPWARRGETKIKTDKKLTFSQPLACSHWFERSKALNKDKWLKIAKKVYRND